MKIVTVNPATGKKIATYTEHSDAEIDDILRKNQSAFLKWRETGYEQRSRLFRIMAAILRERKEDFARTVTAEMGKLISESRAEVEKCAWVCEYYADNTALFLKPEFISTVATRSYITFNPLGSILAIMPWNFPFWQVFRFCAPALMAGNACLLKHASNVPGCALSIETLFRQAGFPDDLFRVILRDGKDLSKVISSPIIKAISVTGSSAAGRAIASEAGRHLKKTVLELGGNDPYLILADADLDKAVEICFLSRMINGGQSCIAAKRFIPVREIASEFTEKLILKMKKVKMGDPLDTTTELGPLARMDLRNELHKQVTGSIAMGAKCLLGGIIPPIKGSYYPPTVLTAVSSDMPAYREELFGPVAVIIPAQDETAAWRIANDSTFGLGAAVFTRDVQRAEKIAADKLETGSCFINTYVRSDPRLPFGGIKDSGYGRELSHYGIKEFVNIKTIYIE
ncbi:MAG: NAD-dependent succinate-semialdehyde dehydrogenase [Candidatus Cloacimonetes bacterium]|nr:NAD-dependent succinate-semialdehyde dehydrogenase [Candidatus Cloacimonadota bacterium]